MPLAQALLLMMLAPCLLGALYSPDSGSKFAVQPVRLVRLLNSVYGSEHLLLFGRAEECLHAQITIPPAHSSQSRTFHWAGTALDTPRCPSPRRPDLLMSTLLAFDQAATLEAVPGGGGRGLFGDLGLAGKLLARTDFFEAVARQPYGPWELAQRARRAEGVADAMVRHLAKRGRPVERRGVARVPTPPVLLLWPRPRRVPCVALAALRGRSVPAWCPGPPRRVGVNRSYTVQVAGCRGLQVRARRTIHARGRRAAPQVWAAAAVRGARRRRG